MNPRFRAWHVLVGLLLAQTLVGLAVVTVAILAFVADPFTNPDLAGIAVYGGVVAGVAVIAAIVSLPALALLVLGRGRRVAAVVLLGLAVAFVAVRPSEINVGTVGVAGTFVATAAVAWREAGRVGKDDEAA